MTSLVFILLVASPDVGRFWRTDQRTPEGRSHRGLLPSTRSTGSSFAPLFSFAGPDRAGIGSVDCECESVSAYLSGDGLQAMSFTRSSVALCVPESGDFVECAADKPRIQNGGFYMEDASTNYVLRNEELDNAAWYKLGAGGAAPTVTAGFADPMGTTTAERVQIDACPSSGNYSIIGQNFSINRGTVSVYLYGNGADSQLSLVLLGSGAAHILTVCNVTNGVWTRCSVGANPAVTVNSEVDIGCWNHPSVPGASNTGAADVIMWRPQAEETPTGNGGYVSSAIKTVAASVTRAADSQLKSTFTTPIPGSTSLCVGASVVRGNSIAFGGLPFFVLTDDSTDDATAKISTNTGLQFDANSSSENPTVAAIGTALRRLIWGATSTWDGASLAITQITTIQPNDIVYVGSSFTTTSNVVVGTSGCQ